MRGNYYNDPRFGATGERNVPEGASYETYTDDNGVTRTRILDKPEPQPV